MAVIKVSKEILKYIEPEFNNQVFHVAHEDEYIIEYIFSEDELLTYEEIKGMLITSVFNSFDLASKLGKDRIKRIKQVLRESKVDPQIQQNLLFMVLFAKAGIDSNYLQLLHANVRNTNISNLFKTKLISLENLRDTEITITNNGIRATFNNLHLTEPILDNFINFIAQSLRLQGYNNDLFNELSCETPNKSKLRSIATKFDKNIYDHKKHLILLAAHKIITYLNDINIYTRKGTIFGTDEQLTLITDLFLYVGYSYNIPNKVFRERIRDAINKTQQ
jgi:hypothetical protein